MEGFIIFILVIVLLYYVGKWYLRRKLRSFMERFGQPFGQPFGDAQTGANQGSQTGSSSGKKSAWHKTSSNGKTSKTSSSQQEKAKVFGKDEGKYVDFEEVKE